MLEFAQHLANTTGEEEKRSNEKKQSFVCKHRAPWLCAAGQLGCSNQAAAVRLSLRQMEMTFTVSFSWAPLKQTNTHTLYYFTQAIPLGRKRSINTVFKLDLNVFFHHC